MADVELLPLPSEVRLAIRAYARACVEANLAPLQAENERLRAEVREAREFRDKMANAIGNDQLRRFIEKHGEPVPLTIRMQQAEARAERLAEALRPHIEDLERSAVVLDQYPAMAPTASEMRKAAAELRAALHPTAAQAAENERLRDALSKPGDWARALRLADGDGGMTLRDYFAAKALPAMYLGLCDDVRAFGEAAPEDWDMGVARDAYKLADAMLKAREGEQ